MQYLLFLPFQQVLRECKDQRQTVYILLFFLSELFSSKLHKYKLNQCKCFMWKSLHFESEREMQRAWFNLFFIDCGKNAMSLKIHIFVWKNSFSKIIFTRQFSFKYCVVWRCFILVLSKFRVARFYTSEDSFCCYFLASKHKASWSSLRI